MEGRKDKKSNVKRKIALVISILIAISFFSVISIQEFYADPVRIMYYYNFDNGTAKWVESDVIVYHDLGNGTIFGGYVGDVIQELNLDSSLQKVIHLKDGTIDYYYEHEDFIGSRTNWHIMTMLK